MIKDDRKESDDPSLWRFLAMARENNNPRHLLSGVKAHFSPGFVFADPDRFIAPVCRWVERLDSIHGSAGLGALSVPGGEITEDAYYDPWLAPYPALEYDAMGSYFNESKNDGDYKWPRSSNWLTTIGEDNVTALGGWQAVEAKLTPGMEFIPCGRGFLVRACDLLALGDSANGGVPEGYRTIARIIKPIRFERYRFGVIREPVPVDAPEATLKWLRRFE